MIPYGRQDLSEEDIGAVVRTLRSEYITQGPAVSDFENTLSGLTNSAHAVAFNSATSALHAACLALDAGCGSLVWTSPISFVASSNCALYCGAEVDFVDIEPDTFNMSVTALSQKLEQASRTGRLPDIVIPVHFAGQSCDMAEIADLSEKYGFRIIEDASHAVGGTYRDHPVGDCRFSDIVVFSFHPVKIITSGEGGMGMTQSTELADKMRLLASHGITKDPSRMERDNPDPWFYEQTALGFNYRMTDIQAALGTSQCSRLTEFVDARNRLAQRYDELLHDIPVKTPVVSGDRRSAFHLYVVLLEGRESDRATVFDRLRSADIGVNVHYIPIYKQPFYRNLGFPEAYCENAERYYSRCISLPMFPGLTKAEQDHVVRSLTDALVATGSHSVG